MQMYVDPISGELVELIMSDDTSTTVMRVKVATVVTADPNFYNAPTCPSV